VINEQRDKADNLV